MKYARHSKKVNLFQYSMNFISSSNIFFQFLQPKNREKMLFIFNIILHCYWSSKTNPSYRFEQWIQSLKLSYSNDQMTTSPIEGFNYYWKFRTNDCFFEWMEVVIRNSSSFSKIFLYAEYARDTSLSWVQNRWFDNLRNSIDTNLHLIYNSFLVFQTMNTVFTYYMMLKTAKKLKITKINVSNYQFGCVDC